MIRLILPIVVLLIFFSCGYVDQGEKLFSRMGSAHTGITFSNDLIESDSLNMIEYLYFNNGAGVAAGDINNDGLIDLYFTANQKSNALYLNSGDFNFQDITLASGTAGTGDWSTGVIMADVNGDGWLDIYVCQVSDYKGLKGQNQLFINNGDLTFTDRASEYGLDFAGFSTQAAFFDYDLDGDLDMYLLNHSVHGSRTYGMSSLRYERDLKAGDRLYRQDEVSGRRHYTDVSMWSGILGSQIGYGLGIGIGDLNNDGYPDIYVSNDFHEIDYLYINNGDGTFKESFQELMTHGSRSSMGNDIADFNNDGWLDIMVLDMLPANEGIRKRSGGEDDYELYEIKRNFGYYDQYVRNVLQYNLGNGLFTEIGRLAGIYSTDWSWSPLFCDLDNDGYKDLFITNGIFRRANDLDYIDFLLSENKPTGNPNSEVLSNPELYEKMPLDALENYVFLNNAGKEDHSMIQPENHSKFSYSNMASAWGLAEKTFSNGASYADLDNDGDLDLVVNNINQPAGIYRNNSESITNHNYLQVELKGTSGNDFGIGARVSLYMAGETRIIENNATRGFMSSVPPGVLHFGLGRYDHVDSLVVQWPGDWIEYTLNVPANKRIILDIEDASKITIPVPSETEQQKVFEKVEEVTGLDFVHRENAYSPFKTQALIPHSLSQEGPCLAVADVNNDGYEDVYLGGAKGQASALYVGGRRGFRQQDVPVFREHFGYEDVDAVFLDADSDGDQDLYVVSGGDESSPVQRLNMDRLYLNDGNGVFIMTQGYLPEFYHNGSCVSVTDFDMDGDLDLFVGSHSVTTAYGLSPESYLLENSGDGRFLSVAASKAEALQAVGMVTDAEWIDYDQDGDPDLFLVGEWMPVVILDNENGHLRPINFPEGLSGTTGWWYSIKATDIDRDGDMDFIAGNLGRNTMFQAETDSCISMYVNDFNQDGMLEQIVTHRIGNKEYAFAYKDDLSRQLDFIEEEFANHADFAGRTVQEIFKGRSLEESIIREACLFESSIFLNEGDGFKRIPLPIEVQFAPVREILVEDFDADGIPDILVGGNVNSVRPLYGKYEASYGWFLNGRGDANFEIQYPQTSGFGVPGVVSKMCRVTLPDEEYIIVARNDRPVMAFTIHPINGSSERDVSKK